MKKLEILLVTLLAIVSLAACGNEENRQIAEHQKQIDKNKDTLKKGVDSAANAEKKRIDANADITKKRLDSRADSLKKGLEEEKR